MKSNKDKASYSLGYEAGFNLKNNFAEVDPSLLEEGFRDGLSQENPKLPMEEIRSILGNIQQQIQTQQKKAFTKMAEENRTAAETFLAENKQKEGIHCLASGVQYKILSAGEGGAHPTLLDNVTIHYRGTFLDGKVFDSSYQRGKPQSFPVNGVIPGWSEVVQKMSVGDKWQVFIPPYLAYGERGLANAIPPNMLLIFEMELLSINA